MLPVLAIIGRPNVGKSTLYNQLTRTRDALVADEPGVTRDRQYGEGRVGERPFVVVDTGGLAEPDDPEMAAHTDKQVEQALLAADKILLVLDAQTGITAADEAIVSQLRRHQDKIIPVINKADHQDKAMVASEFYALGLGEPQVIAAHRGRGIAALADHALSDIPEVEEEAPPEKGIRVAVLGRPNVGKSTLINRLLGEDRVVVCDRSGTTRDSIFIPFSRQGKDYTLIDTAGIRRRKSAQEKVETFSVLKAMQAVRQAQIVIVVCNAREGITEQDARLLGTVVEAGKGLILAVNQWDGLPEDQRQQVEMEIDRRLSFIEYARRYYISALHGSGVGQLYRAIHEIEQALEQDFTTNSLTSTLEKAVTVCQPPMARGRRAKCRFAHLGERDPLTIIIHGKQVESLPASYRRYLTNYVRKQYNLVGVSLRLQFKNDANPYVSVRK